MKVNGFDIDGVIHLGNGVCGVRPGPNDVIITGRSHEEAPETKAFLLRNGINNHVYFNPLTFDEKSRQSSGEHKAKTLKFLKNEVYFNPLPFKVKSRESSGTHKARTLQWLKEVKTIDVQFFFEDDEVQKAEIKKSWNGKVIHVSHDFTEKENVRHLEDLDG